MRRGKQSHRTAAPTKRRQSPGSHSGWYSKLTTTKSAFGRALVFAWIRNTITTDSKMVLYIVILVILTSILAWGWQSEHLHPYIATAASAIGALLIGGAAFATPRYQWTLLLCGGLFTAWVTWFTAVDVTAKDAKILQQDYRLRKLHDYFIQFVGRSPQNLPDQVLTDMGSILNNRFQEALMARDPSHSYDAARDLIELLTAIDTNNGHALYFSGEIDWHRRVGDYGSFAFYTYLEQELRYAPQFRQNDTSVMACRNPKGYCRQRTAWVSHVLANQLLQRALNRERAGLDATAEWGEVLEKACDAEIVCGIFEQYKSTKTLVDEAKRHLPGRMCRCAVSDDFFGRAPFSSSVITAKTSNTEQKQCDIVTLCK